MARPCCSCPTANGAALFMPKARAVDGAPQAGLAFPLYATALWLFWVAGRQTGVDVMACRAARRPAAGPGCGCGAAPGWPRSFATLSHSLALCWPAGARQRDRTVASLPEGAVAYSPGGLDTLRARGRTRVRRRDRRLVHHLSGQRACRARPRTNGAAMPSRDSGVTYMVADWTDYDPDDRRLRHQPRPQRYPPVRTVSRRQSHPMILPQMLRRSTVLDALGGLPGARVAARELKRRRRHRGTRAPKSAAKIA
jgi:hypothetical protein